LVAWGDGEGGGQACSCNADAAEEKLRQNARITACVPYMPVTVDKLAHRGVDRAGWAAAGAHSDNRTAARLQRSNNGKGSDEKRRMREKAPAEVTD
jgi:hypothetical protein